VSANTGFTVHVLVIQLIVLDFEISFASFGIKRMLALIISNIKPYRSMDEMCFTSLPPHY